MIFTGNNYLSISNQTGLSFNLNISLNNITGICNLGFTGGNTGEINNINFKLSSGRVLDPENRVVSFYSPQENVNISGDISPNNYSYYINNNLLCLNGKKNNFIINQYYINTSGCSADSTVSVLGTKPNYQLNLDPVFYIQDGSYINGAINNSNGLTFKIYSGTVNIPSGFNIYALPQFVTNNEIFRINHYANTQNQIEDERSYQIQVNLFTNFGQITQNFTSVGSFSGFYNLNLSLTDLTDYFARTGTETALGAVRNNNYYVNIGLESGNLRAQTKIFNKNLYTKLEYFGGVTGKVTGNIFASGYKNFTLTNYIIESGYLTGTTTLAATGYHALSGVYVTGTISGSRSEFSYFTGYAVDNTTFRSLTGYYLSKPYIRNQAFPVSGFTSTGKYYYQDYIYDTGKIINLQSIVNLPYNNQYLDLFNVTKINSSGTMMLVNSINEPSISYSTGVVRIYTGDGTYFNLAKTYSGLKGDLNFGAAISVDQEGKNFTISAIRQLPGDFTYSGRVYTFTGLNQDINAVNYIQGSGGSYGSATALNSGNILAISVPNKFLGVTSYGASVEIYKKIGTSWNKIKIVSGDINDHDDYFGYSSISINNKGDILLIGTPENNNITTGRAYIFTGNDNLTDYGLLTKLKGGLSITDNFGYYTSLNKEGNIAAVSSNTTSGYVCIYTGNKNNFVQTNIINYSGPDINYNFFGNKIKLNDSGNFLISNAPGDNFYYGSTYVYSGNNNNWTNITRIDPFNLKFPNYGFLINDFTRINDKNVYFGTDLNLSTEIFTYLDYSGYINEYIIGAGNISNTNNYLLTGLLTGQTYIKEFSGAFNMFTGYYSGGIVVGLTNFNNKGYFTGNRYVNSGIINSGLNQLYYQITTKNYFDNNELTGKLTISGYNDDITKNNVIIRYVTGIK
jgi:hypothetical protein